MQTITSFAVIFACLAAVALAWNFPVDVKFINAPSAQLTVGSGSPVNVSVFFKRGNHQSPDVYRVSQTNADGDVNTYWVVENWNRTGQKPGHGGHRKPMPMFVTADVYKLSKGTCVKTVGSKLTCSPWIGMSFGGKMQTTSNCSGGPGQSPLQFSVNTKRGGEVTKQVMKDGTTETSFHFKNQEKKSPAKELMTPCTPSSGSNEVAVENFSFGGLGGLFDIAKCTSCQVGIGALLGKLCNGGGSAACSAFPPARPFCPILVQAGCKAGAAKLNKDTACKMIHLC